MRFVGTHKTVYSYSSPVALAPHTFRLRPRANGQQVVREFTMVIEPAPTGRSDGTDAWGNDVVWAWFVGEHVSLEISTHFDVDVLVDNPFNFVVPTAEGSVVPPTYSDEERVALSPYVQAGYVDPTVVELAEEASEAAKASTVAFPVELARIVHERCEMIVRPEGDPFAGARTLAEGKGSCRDLTVLFIEACRHKGVAARFVSGYVAGTAPGEDPELHAWASVYMPGGGWRDFDPSQGLAVSSGHVSLAAAAHPAGAAPVTGGFSSNGATSSLHSTINLRVENAMQAPH